MTIRYKSARQLVIAAELEVSYADLLGNSGTALDALQLPAGARVVGGDIVVTEAFNSVTSDVLKFGDAGDDDRYGAAINLQALARTALILTGYQHLLDTFEQVKWTGVGTAPTAGAFRITVLYVVNGRTANFTQGLDFRASGVPGA